MLSFARSMKTFGPGHVGTNQRGVAACVLNRLLGGGCFLAMISAGLLPAAEPITHSFLGVGKANQAVIIGEDGRQQWHYPSPASDGWVLPNGNVLLDELHGATIERRPGGVDMNAELLAATERKKDEGFNAYAIPGGGSNPIGALGYVSCMAEIIAQTNSAGLTFDCLIHATGSAGTQAGLVAGAAIMRPDMDILGIGVRAPQEKQESNVFALAQTTADLLGHHGVVERHTVKANCDYIGQGYGIPHQTTIDAIRLLARLDGILLDPVYSAKGMAGLIGLVQAGHFKKGQRILFLHTGGQSALFGYFKQLQS